MAGPFGSGTDGAAFSPATMEAFSSRGDGTLTVVKEKSPTEFTVEQNVQTQVSAKTMTFDSKTGHIFLIAAEYDRRPRRLPEADAAAAEGQCCPTRFQFSWWGNNASNATPECAERRANGKSVCSLPWILASRYFVRS
jgi:hypothetical protein